MTSSTLAHVKWPWFRRPSVAQGVLLFAIIAAAHFAGSELAYSVNKATSDGVPLFPAAGVTVAFLLLVPRRSWPIILAATFFTELGANVWLIGEVAGTAIGSALSNTVEPLLGAYVVLRLVGGPPSLSRRQQLTNFVIGAVVAGPALGAVVGAASTQLTAGHPAYFDVLGRWFTGDALGVLVVGSLILAWAVDAPLPTRLRQPLLEASVAAGAIVGLTLLAFWGSTPALAYLAIPPLGWAAVRFGARGATLGGAAVALIADWATLQGHGLFAVLAGNHHDRALWQLQLFLGVLLITALVVATQVSELNEAERALVAGEEQKKLNSLLESSPDPVWILGQDAVVQYVNRQLEVLTDRDRTELIGMPFGGLLSDQRRLDGLATLRSIAHAPVGSRSEFEMPGLGEALGRSLEVAFSPLDTEDGRLFVGTIRDVTERKAAEVRLRNALEAAQEATRAKTEFLATMSHEIRTPMNGVIGMVDVLRRSHMDPSQVQMVSTIGDSARALLTIIDDILDFSKIEAGKLELELSPFSVRDLVDGIGELLASTAAAKDLEIVCAVDPSVPEAVVGDALRVRQVLFNLVGNAVKFTSEGSVWLDVTTTDGGIDFSVTDTGIGITAEQQRSLFQPFVQAEQSTTRRFGGSGLGLSIVARLVELMGSTVTCTSTPDEGSTFGFVLNLPEAQEPTATRVLEGLHVVAVVTEVPADQVVVRAIERAGALVDPVAPAELAAATEAAVDAVFISRMAAAASVLASAGSVPVVASRGADGRELVPAAQPVETNAITGRSVVQALAAATGRTVTTAQTAQPGAVEPGAVLRGDLVLVAEDNPTNQLVIRHQLRNLGFDCEVAVDGIEALKLLQTKRFALVLADLHMPRLDGIELTTRIRELEAGTDRHMPVIALTAAALPSERERCLEAGMDLVLTKPIEVDRLWEALSWALPNLQAEPNGGTVASAAPSTQPQSPDHGPPQAIAQTIDLSLVREIIGDDDDELALVIQLFRDSASESRTTIENAATWSDPDVVFAAHKLRGSALSIGADPLAERCRQLEAGEAADGVAVLHELEAVLAEIDATVLTNEPRR